MEAEDFINELIESQLLVSELAPALTGPETSHALVSTLRECAETTNIADRLEQTEHALAALDAKGLGNSPERYRSIADSLQQLPAPVNLQRLFQIDMVKPAPEATLSQGPLKEIIRGVELLHRITPKRQHNPLDRFRESFIERYGEGREVPLLHVLDADVGIGFNSTVKWLSRSSSQQNYSLCHGIGGNVDLLIYAGQLLNKRDATKVAQQKAMEGIELHANGETPWPCGTYWGGQSLGLMQGLSGIGYFYLRLCDPIRVPPVTIILPNAR